MPQIKTFCRVKPTEAIYEDHELTEDKIFLRVPEVLKDFNAARASSRSTINHEFRFDYIFKQDTTQEEVFDIAAQEIVKGFLNGYNGTIFAYGQTGTGKTYTIEGSAQTYNQRGLEPRALSMIYNELENRTDEDLSIHISYLEIYQEVGYDLLNPGLRTQSYVTPFPKVAVLEGYGGLCIVKNLSSHLAASEDVAQSLLLQGSANRKVAATAVHDRSSRSHAVFTIQLTSKKLDSDTIVRSKLHLVDLAGSERVSKTGVHGQQLTEAKSINLSLHYLENVIIALQQESLSRARDERTKSSSTSRKFNISSRPASANGVRGSSANGLRGGGRHVPYRNSLLTMLLRDSLGGNCMTAMIATISLEIFNLSESISTCRFAGRVACIANTVSRNEELDDKSLIRKLRKRIAELEAEIACLREAQLQSGGDNNHRMTLTEEDKHICTKIVQQYLAGKITDPVSAGITDPYKFRECLKIVKRFISKKGLAPNPDKSESRMSLSVTLPHTSPTPEEKGEPDDVSQAVDNTNESNVLKPRRNSHVLKDHDNSVVNETKESGSHSNETREAPLTRSTSAWTEVTSSTVQQPSVTPSNNQESVWVSNSKKDPETLSMMLKTSEAKSPFEQKRVKEIKQLNTKVEKMNTELMEKEQKVVEMKIQVAEHELNLMERHMKTKLGVTTAQVEDQKAYIKQLVSTEADPALIQQEKLVEHQLKKRLHKFERQLEYIDYRREQLKKRQENTEEAFEKKASLQDKYGQYRKRDGSLNTRQVFQMLKSEEKKQVKAQNRMDREKVITTSDLMEVKELAKRQKLRELKEAMKAGNVPKAFENPGLIPNGHVEEMESHTTGKGHHSHKDANSQRVPKGSNSHQLKHEGVMNGWDDSDNKTRPTTKDSGFSRTETFVVENNSAYNKFGSSMSVRSGSSQIVPGPEFYAPKKEEKDPTSKWESNYSRPTTPSNLKIPETEETGYSVKVKGGVIVMDNKNEQVKASNRTTNSSNKDSVKSENKTNNAEESKKKGLSNDLLDSRSKQLEEELLNNRNRQQKERFKKPALFESLPKDAQTYMPSEYIYGMNQGEKFDARKMGLNSKNFDSALTSMLQEDQNVYASYNDYDQFARTKAYKPSPYVQVVESTPPKKPKPVHKSREKHRERDERYASAEKRLSRGQDGSPLSTKISQYLQQSPKRERRQGRASSASGVKGVDISDISRFRQSSATLLLDSHNSAVEIEEEEHPGKVTALKEKEREENYMNKAQAEKDRVTRIRKARQSAEVIQRCWRRYIAKKRRKALR